MKQNNNVTIGHFTRENCPLWLNINSVTNSDKYDNVRKRIADEKKRVETIIKFQGKTFIGYKDFAKYIGVKHIWSAKCIAKKGHRGPDKVEVIVK